MAKKKVLLMGKAHSGKTSMRSIIFANYLARDTTRLSPTLDVEHHHVRFLGDLVLNLWDCGGQDAFYESYFERDRETIFRSVELLIYVFDIESDQPEKDFDHFAGVLEAIEENSPDARIFVLVHKMDLVAQEDRHVILEDRKRLIEVLWDVDLGRNLVQGLVRNCHQFDSQHSIVGKPIDQILQSLRCRRSRLV
jgi:Ras-related GTP-binding protein A/B